MSIPLDIPALLALAFLACSCWGAAHWLLALCNCRRGRWLRALFTPLGAWRARNFTAHGNYHRRLALAALALAAGIMALLSAVPLVAAG